MPEDLSGNLPIFDIRWVYGAEEGGCAPIDWRGSPPSARGSGPTPGGYPEPPKDQIFLSSAFHPKSFDIFDNFLPKSAQNGRCFWGKKTLFGLVFCAGPKISHVDDAAVPDGGGGFPFTFPPNLPSHRTAWDTGY